MLEFSTAARRTVEEDEADQPDSIEFAILEKDPDGTIKDTIMCTAYRPGDGQLAVLMAMTNRSSSTNERMAGIINFFASVLDEQSHSYVVNRLLDRRDDFGVNDVSDIMEGLIAEWSGRPTVSSNGSSKSPKSVGQKSTRSTTKST